jgi:hypothetical protein
MRRRRLPSGLPSCALVVVAACASSPRHQPLRESSHVFAVPIAATEHALEVRIGDGRVTVTHADTPTCEITAYVRAATREEADRRAGRLRLVPDDTPDGVTLLTLDTAQAHAREGVNLCITVAAPPRLAVRVLTRRAEVIVHGYKGDLDVDTDSGSVTARLDGGAAAIRSRSGGVRISGSFASALVHAETAPVQVVLPVGESAPRVDVQTTTGDVTFELPQDGQASFSARVRSPHSVPCELAANWSEYGADAGERWKSYRGVIGAPVEAAFAKSNVNVVSDSGRVTLRCIPGS